VIIAVSSYIRRKLLEKGYPERKVILHRNGIDTQFFRPGPFSARKPIVLFVGRFVEKKGARYLVEAAGKLLGQGVNFDLVLIGNGPLEGDLRAAVGEMGIRCQFMGFLPVEAVRGWLERASVVVVPSVVASD